MYPDSKRIAPLSGAPVSRARFDATARIARTQRARCDDANCEISNTAASRNCAAGVCAANTAVCPCSANNLTEFDRNFALAMSYVPVQQFENVTDSCASLKSGTIFADLVKPFGKQRRV